MRCTVLSSDEAPRRKLKIWCAVEVFLMNFEVFHLVVKHCVKCLILLLKQMILEREIRSQKWAVFHLVSKHSLNINLLACFAGYTCRSSWQQTLLKVQSQFQTSNMVSAHFTPQSYNSATVWTGPSIFIGTNIFVKKKKLLFLLKVHFN